MRKKVVLVFTLTGALIASASAASAASVDMHAASSQVPAAAKLAVADASTGQQSDQATQPGVAKPKPRKKRRSLAFLLLGLAAAGGTVAAVASDGNSHPASP